MSCGICGKSGVRRRSGFCDVCLDVLLNEARAAGLIQPGAGEVATALALTGAVRDLL